MSLVVVEFGKDEAVNPGSAPVMTFDLVDRNGTAINAAAIETAICTLRDISNTGEVVNGRLNQSCLNTGIGAFSGSTLTITLAAADTQLVGGQARKFQHRLLTLSITFTTGSMVVLVYFWVRNPTVTRE